MRIIRRDVAPVVTGLRGHMMAIWKAFPDLSHGRDYFPMKLHPIVLPEGANID
jgi:hypothetical protein